jgi:hypothetical protein
MCEVRKKFVGCGKTEIEAEIDLQSQILCFVSALKMETNLIKNPLQRCTEYFQSLGLLFPKFHTYSEGLAHCLTWKCSTINPINGKEFTASANSKQTACQLVAAKLYTELPKKFQEFETYHLNRKIILNPPVLESKTQIRLAGLDFERDVNSQEFVCAQVAEYESENILIFTNLQEFHRYAKCITKFILCQATQDVVFLPKGCSYIDVVTLLDANKFNQKTIGLRQLSRHFLKKDVCKDLQLSFRIHSNLSLSQLEYAAIDAIVVLEIYLILEKEKGK